MSLLDSRVPITARSIERVIEYHNLPLDCFAGKTVLDLGCGASDLGQDLAEEGINANVIGIDMSDLALHGRPQLNASSRRIKARLEALPIRDEAADIVLATYSLPLWANTVEEIYRFYDECKRVVKPDGVLSVYPISACISGEDTMWDRGFAAKMGAQAINSSSNWLSYDHGPDILTARRIA